MKKSVLIAALVSALGIALPPASIAQTGEVGQRPLTLPGLSSTPSPEVANEVARVEAEEEEAVATAQVTQGQAARVDTGEASERAPVAEESPAAAMMPRTVPNTPTAGDRYQPKKPSLRIPGVKAPPPIIELRNGQNVVMAIAYSHLNRVITPFERPVVETTSTAITKVDGSLVYVATNIEEPIALFVHNEGSPEVAISLTLVPAEIPPISTEIRLTDVEVKRSEGKTAVVTDAAEAFESSHAYPQMLTTLLRDIAQGQVPDGFGFEVLQAANPWMPACRQPNVHVQAMQLVTGTSVMAFVARATNIGQRTEVIDEAACDAPHVRAVAAWPESELSPGESTELYVVVSVPEEVNTAVTRPSLVGAN